MLPQASISDPGYATAGTVYGGPYTGPDTFLENGLTFLDITEPVVLKDAIASLADGTAPTNQHAYLIAKNDVSNVIAVIYSTQVPPNSNLRSVPGLKFVKGDKLYIRAVQLSGTAVEVTNFTLMWKH